MYSMRHGLRVFARGVTLIELIIGIAVLGILAAVALPSFTETIQSNTQTSQINTLLSSLHLARSEAIKRNSPVTLCKSNDNSTCNTDNDNHWERGWIVFVDSDGNGTRASAEELLRAQSAMGGDTTLRSTTTFNNRIIYSAKGINLSTTAGLFSLCDDRGASDARAVRITATGHSSATHKSLNGSALSCL